MMELLDETVSKQSTKMETSFNEMDEKFKKLEEAEGPNMPNDKVELGGPMSAFSSLYSHEVSEGKNLPLDRPAIHDYGNKFEQLAFKSSYFQDNKSGIYQDLPVAPAFVQIFQRRRRRENRPRRQRTTFTSEQTLKLELEYSRADYITRPRRYELAEILSLSESQIKIWFQNRRAKDKRIEKAHMDQQLRAMGFPHFHGQFPFPMTPPSFCGACGPPASSLSFLQPLCPVSTAKQFQLL